MKQRTLIQRWTDIVSNRVILCSKSRLFSGRLCLSSPRWATAATAAVSYRYSTTWRHLSGGKATVSAAAGEEPRLRRYAGLPRRHFRYRYPWTCNGSEYAILSEVPPSQLVNNAYLGLQLPGVPSWDVERVNSSPWPLIWVYIGLLQIGTYNNLIIIIIIIDNIIIYWGLCLTIWSFVW